MAPSLLALGAIALAYTGSASAATPPAKTYQRAESYNSTNFFDKFDFFTSRFDTHNYNDVDPTSGFVNYRSKADALSMGIVNTLGSEVYIGVDHATKIASIEEPGRSSVRLESKNTYQSGLFIATFTHFPKPICGSWPAYWLLGNTWPTDGEIDIYENWNNAANNIPAIHTTYATQVGSCKLQQGNMKSTIRTTDCDNYYTDFSKGQYQGTGCSVNEYGGPWGAESGGVYATQWTDETISIWSWPTGSVPANVHSATPNPSTWGLPIMSVKSDSCNIKEAFKNQKLVLNIDFCGVTAGNDDIWGGQCATSTGVSGKDACKRYVASNPDVYDDVYWKISSIDIFQLAAPVVTSSTTSTSSTRTSSSTSSTRTSSSTSTSTTSTRTSSSTTPTSSSTSSTRTSSSSTSTSTSSTRTSSSLTSTSTSTTSTPSSSASSSTSSSSASSISVLSSSSSASVDLAASTSSSASSSSSDVFFATGTGSSPTGVVPTGPYGNATSSAPTSFATGGTGIATGTGGGVISTSEGPYANTTTSVLDPTTTYDNTAIATGTGSSDPGVSTSAGPYTNTTTTYPAGGSPGVTSPGSPAVTSPVSLTTSTIYTTTVYTVTSCAPTVTNCPAGPHVTTETIAIGTTVCPVSDKPAAPTGGASSGSSAAPLPEGWTTTTVYSTTTYTITSCKPTVTDCPGKIGQVTTEVVAVGTTICPVESVEYSFSTRFTTVQATTTKHLPAPGASTTTPVVVEITATVVPSSAVAPVKGSSSYVPVKGGSSSAPSAGLPIPSGNGTAIVPVVTPTKTPIVTAGAAKAGVSIGMVALVAALFAL